MKKQNIVLIGFMLTGKTTIGKLTAKQMGWTFVDSDHIIELREGVSIPELFSSKGEAYFRGVETEVIRNLLQQKEQVISTGGGSVLMSANRDNMLKHSYVIALTAKTEEIIERAGLDPNRPLLQGNVEERIRLLLEQRRHAYDFADMSIDTSSGTKDSIVNKIIKRMKELKS